MAETPGWAALYEYVLREWWEGWDTPAAISSTDEIIAALSDAGFVIAKRAEGTADAIARSRQGRRRSNVIPTEHTTPRLAIHRNRDGFLLGASWSYSPEWSPRLTHFYLGWWVLTLRTAGAEMTRAERDVR